MADEQRQQGPMAWFYEAKGFGEAPVPESVKAERNRYIRAESRARRGHILLESSGLLVTAAIPACAAFAIDSSLIAILGSLAIVINGARQLFG